MPTFDEIMNKAKELAQTAGDKSQEVYAVAKAKIEISDLERKIQKNFASIGKTFYECEKSGEAMPDTSALIEEIDLLKKEIEDKESEICKVKSNAVCPNCGADIVSGNDFCPKCGSKL